MPSLVRIILIIFLPAGVLDWVCESFPSRLPNSILNEASFVSFHASNSPTGHIPGENHNSKRCMYPNAHCSSVHNSQDREATWVSIHRGPDKENVGHTYNGILLTRNKERNCATSRDEDLETVTQSEIRKRKTDTVC